MLLKTYPIITISYVCLIVSGCAPKMYIYDGIVYTDPEKALQAQRTLFDDHIREMNISPLSEPLASKGLVVLPDKNLIGTQLTIGRPKEFCPKNHQKEYMIASTELDIEWYVRLMRERRIFGQTELQKSDMPEKVPVGSYDAVVYLSSNGRQWLVKMRKRSKPKPIYTNYAVKPGAEQYWNWLINLERVLKEQ